jgi:hypothetical protein
MSCFFCVCGRPEPRSCVFFFRFKDDDFVSFKVRPSNYGEDISFERPLSTKINELKIDVYKHLKLDSTTDRLRFFYQGKRMEEIHTLGKPKRVKKDMVITAFISKNVTE